MQQHEDQPLVGLPSQLTELPVELLELLGQYLSPKDLLQALPSAHPYLNRVFNEEYWRTRVRKNFPELPPDDLLGGPFRNYLTLTISKRPKRSSWKQYGAHLEWRHRQFAGNRWTSTVNSLSNGTATFTAVSFADHGNLILYALGNDDGKIHVTTGESLGKEEWSDSLNSEHVIYKHERSCTTIQSNGSRFSSSGPWDERIAVYDLQPFQCNYVLRTESPVDAHAFLDHHHIVAKSRDGMISVFDVRSSLDPVQRIPAFQQNCTFVCSLQCDDMSVITGGDEGEFKWLKRVDLRINHVVANAQVCKFEPNFNTQDGTALHLNEGILWVGGLTSDAVAYNPSSLKVLQDFGPAFNLSLKTPRRVCGLHYNERQVLLVKNNSCTMLDIWKKPKVIWSHSPEIYCSHMDFDYKRSMMVICGYDCKNPSPNGEPTAVVKLLKPDENLS